MVTREQLRFYCQKVLPLAYDDSLSYYELLCKVLGKVNELVLQYDQIVQNFNVILTDYLESADFQNLLEKFIKSEIPDYTYVQHYVTYLGMSDTDAVKEAVKDCPLHGTVIFPRRTMHLTETIVLDKPICLKGNYTGWVFDMSTDKYTAEQFQEHSIISTASPSIQISVPGVLIQNMAICGTNPTTGAHVIHIEPGPTNVNKSMRYVNLEHVYVYTSNVSTGSCCIYMDNLFKSTFYDVSTHGGAYGFYHDGTRINGTSLTFDNCWAVNSAYLGYYINNLFYSTFLSCATDSYSGAVNGYRFSKCKGIHVIGCGAEHMSAACFVANECLSSNFLVSMSGDNYNTAATKAGAFEMSNCQSCTVGGFHSEDETNPVHRFVKAENSLYRIVDASCYKENCTIEDDGNVLNIDGWYEKSFEVDAAKLFPGTEITESYIVVSNGVMHGYIKQSVTGKRTLTSVATLSSNARLQYQGYYVVENRISITTGDTIIFDSSGYNVKQLYALRKMS